MKIVDRTLDDILDIRKTPARGNHFFVVLSNKYVDKGTVATFDLDEKKARKLHKFLSKYLANEN